jgi:hypothetical protein
LLPKPKLPYDVVGASQAALRSLAAERPDEVVTRYSRLRQDGTERG